MQADAGTIRRVLLTGRPGIGKTTVVRSIAQRLAGLRLLGFYTEEIRRSGRRTGFRAVTFDGKRTVIAHVDHRGPHRVSRYGVDVEAIDRLARATLELRPDVDLYLIDEIGKMECLSERFVDGVRRLFAAPVWTVATVALSGPRLVAEVKSRPGVVIREVTLANRGSLADRIAPWLEEKIVPAGS